MSPREFSLLRALIDRLIPEEDTPGGLSAGVDTFVSAFIAQTDETERAWLCAGLTQLDEESRSLATDGFLGLTPSSQDALLLRWEAGESFALATHRGGPAAWFRRMVDLAHEGFYADPSAGGNRDGVSWRALGYTPRTSQS